MDQGIVASTNASTGARAARLLLMIFGAVLGFLALGFVFGSSSASADDGAGSSDGLGSAVGGLLSSVTAPVAEIAEPVMEPVIDPVVDPVVELVQPIAEPVVQPVVTLVDTTLGRVGELVAPVTAPILTAPILSAPVVTVDAPLLVGPFVAVTAASRATPSEVVDVLAGAARGVIEGSPAATGSPDRDASGASAASGGLFATAAGIGFFALLVLRRHAHGGRAMPGSPAYDTDSSPD